MSTPTVGLVGSRKIDSTLQNPNKKTVTDFAFPEPSRTPLQMGVCPEGSTSYKGPKTGDCYTNSVEDTNMCAGMPIAALLPPPLLGCMGHPRY